MDNTIGLIQHEIDGARERREQLETLIALEAYNSPKYVSLVNESYSLLGRIGGLETAIKHIKGQTTMDNYTTNVAALDDLINTVGAHTFIDSVLERLDKEQAEAIIRAISEEHRAD